MAVYTIFQLLYLSRIHTVPYFGLPLDNVLGGTFFEDGSWGRMWVFYGGFFVLMVLTYLCENKCAKSEGDAAAA